MSYHVSWPAIFLGCLPFVFLLPRSTGQLLTECDRGVRRPHPTQENVYQIFTRSDGDTRWLDQACPVPEVFRPQPCACVDPSDESSTALESRPPSLFSAPRQQQESPWSPRNQEVNNRRDPFSEFRQSQRQQSRAPQEWEDRRSPFPDFRQGRQQQRGEPQVVDNRDFGQGQQQQRRGPRDGRYNFPDSRQNQRQGPEVVGDGRGNFPNFRQGQPQQRNGPQDGPEIFPDFRQPQQINGPQDRRGNFPDVRQGQHQQRNGPQDGRGNFPDFRQGQPQQRNGPQDERGNFLDFRQGQQQQRNTPQDGRGNFPDFRQAQPQQRNGPQDGRGNFPDFTQPQQRNGPRRVQGTIPDLRQGPGQQPQRRREPPSYPTRGDIRIPATPPTTLPPSPWEAQIQQGPTPTYGNSGCGNRRAVGWNSGQFEERVNGVWQRRNCNWPVDGGLVWIQRLCRCGRLGVGQTTNRNISGQRPIGPDGLPSTCLTMLRLNFDEGDIKDAERDIWIDRRNPNDMEAIRDSTAVGGWTGVFQGASLTVPFFHMNTFGNLFRVQFRFQLCNGEPDAELTLVNNGCEPNVLPTLQVSYRAWSRVLVFQMTTENSVGSRLEQCQVRTREPWLDVDIQYGGNLLTVNVNGVQCVRSLAYSGSVTRTPCPLSLLEDNYCGLLDEVVISRKCPVSRRVV